MNYMVMTILVSFNLIFENNMVAHVADTMIANVNLKIFKAEFRIFWIIILDWKEGAG